MGLRRLQVAHDNTSIEAAPDVTSPVTGRPGRGRASVARRLQSSRQHDWDASDWRALFDERAGIAEHDGGLSRVEAEEQAFEACIVEWLNRNPVQSFDDRCIVCGDPDRELDVLLPFGAVLDSHAWLHSSCWAEWSKDRRARAIDTLRGFGLEIGDVKLSTS